MGCRTSKAAPSVDLSTPPQESLTPSQLASRRDQEEAAFLVEEEKPQDDYLHLGDDEFGDPKSAWIRRDGAALEPLLACTTLIDVRWLVALTAVSVCLIPLYITGSEPACLLIQCQRTLILVCSLQATGMHAADLTCV